MLFLEIISPRTLNAGKKYNTEKKGGVIMENQEVAVVSRYQFWKSSLEEQPQEPKESQESSKSGGIDCAGCWSTSAPFYCTSCGCHGGCDGCTWD